MSLEQEKPTATQSENCDVKRCPNCRKAPDMKCDEDTDVWTITCLEPLHGHMAMGTSLTKAIEHWNHYIGFMEKIQAGRMVA